MKAFRNKVKDNSDAEPLLVAASKKMASSSSSDGSVQITRTPLGLKTLAGGLSTSSPVPSAIPCQQTSSPTTSVASIARTSTCSTVHTSPEITPNPSPRDQIRKELPFMTTPNSVQHIEQSSPNFSLSGRKKKNALHYRSHDHVLSPTAIALKKQCATLPASYSSPALWNTAFEAASKDELSKESCNDEDLTIKQTKSEGMTSSTGEHNAKSVDCNYMHSLESAYEKFGVERKLVVLKQPQLSTTSNQNNQPRERASTHPGIVLFTPNEGRKSRPAVSAQKKGDMHHKASITNTTGPIDIDELEEQLEGKLALGMERSRRTSAKKANRSTMTFHSAPAKTFNDKPSLNRFDTERLLCQMGMDVSEEDYCIEGEFARRSSDHDQVRKGRCHSYDCNYPNKSLEHTFENLKQSPEEMEARGVGLKQTREVRSMPQVVMDRIGSFGSAVSSLDDARDRRSSSKHHHGQMVHNKRKSSPQNRNKSGKTLKSKLFSILRGNNNNGHDSGKSATKKDNVPTQIVATTITPTASEDQGDNCPITPEDMRLLYRWQRARARAGGSNSVATDAEVEAHRAVAPAAKSRPSSGKKNYEDVLSITSSCGDKTLPVDNRRVESRHKQGCSF